MVYSDFFSAQNKLLPRQVRKPRSHILETQMLQFNGRHSKPRYTFDEELKGKPGLVGGQSLADTLDEQRVIRGNTQP